MPELEEKGLIKASEPDPEEKRALIEAAKSTLQKDRQVSIRLSSRDLVSLKRKANRFGIPYQTLLTSVLHRYASSDNHLEKTKEMTRPGDADSARHAAVVLRNITVGFSRPWDRQQPGIGSTLQPLQPKRQYRVVKILENGEIESVTIRAEKLPEEHYS